MSDKFYEIKKEMNDLLPDLNQNHSDNIQINNQPPQNHEKPLDQPHDLRSPQLTQQFDPQLFTAPANLLLPFHTEDDEPLYTEDDEPLLQDLSQDVEEALKAADEILDYQPSL